MKNKNNKNNNSIDGEEIGKFLHSSKEDLSDEERKELGVSDDDYSLESKFPINNEEEDNEDNEDNEDDEVIHIDDSSNLDEDTRESQSNYGEEDHPDISEDEQMDAQIINEESHGGGDDVIESHFPEKINNGDDEDVGDVSSEIGKLVPNYLGDETEAVKRKGDNNEDMNPDSFGDTSYDVPIDED